MVHPMEFTISDLGYGRRVQEIRVTDTGHHTVVVAIIDERSSMGAESVAAEVDARDLSRAVAAATDPGLTAHATVRGTDGTVSVYRFGTYCRVSVRSYETGGEADVTLDASPAREMSGFLDRVVMSHPLTDVGQAHDMDSIPHRYETVGFSWGDGNLSVVLDEGAVVVSAVQPSQRRTVVESVTVPLSSFARLVRLAGGDLPGSGRFNTVRGQLSFQYDRHAALQLKVSTDEVDGGRAEVWLDIEQVHELRRMMLAWWPAMS